MLIRTRKRLYFHTRKNLRFHSFFQNYKYFTLINSCLDIKKYGFRNLETTIFKVLFNKHIKIFTQHSLPMNTLDNKYNSYPKVDILG